MGLPTDWLIAAAAGGRYGVPVGSVSEIVEIPPPTPVPLAPDFIRGMINNKGEILPVVDASALLVERRGPDSGIAVVVRHRDTTFGLLVERVEGIRSLFPEAASPARGAGYRERFIAGTARAGEDLLTLLDLDAVVPFIASSLEAIASEGALR